LLIASQAKDQLKQLQEAHDEHTENAANLSDDLKSISEELDRRKKQIDSMVNNVTDANPLVEIRAAIQRLRKENRELDIHIGMLVSAMVSIDVTNSSNQPLSYSICTLFPPSPGL